MDTLAVMCQPPVDDISFGDQEDAKMTERMQALFDADQAERTTDSIDGQSSLLPMNNGELKFLST